MLSLEDPRLDAKQARERMYLPSFSNLHHSFISPEKVGSRPRGALRERKEGDMGLFFSRTIVVVVKQYGVLACEKISLKLLKNK